MWNNPTTYRKKVETRTNFELQDKFAELTS